jgi:hypothetical protein
LPNEPHWLPIDVVIEHNRLETLATGEPHFLRDRGLLESAMARPRNFFSFGEEDVIVLGVLLNGTLPVPENRNEGSRGFARDVGAVL